MKSACRRRGLGRTQQPEVGDIDWCWNADPAAALSRKPDRARMAPGTPILRSNSGKFELLTSAH
jgi:hypothetical protein